MPRTKSGSLPSYRHYKRTGQAVVTIDGRDHYLGEHGSPESYEHYNRLIAEWHDRRRFAHSATPDPATLNVSDVILAYWQYAQSYYRDSAKELERIRLSVRPLRALFGRTAAPLFGPLALTAVRKRMVETGLARITINMRIGVLKRLFKWAAAQELVPPAVFDGLRAVEGLRRGRSSARETKPVGPVPDALVVSVLPFVSRPVRAMIELQQLTGMRSGEVCRMQASDIDQSDEVWTYRPARHKTAYQGKQRLIFLGPRAQQVLTPFLSVPSSAYPFSPRQAMSDRYKALRVARKSKVPPSQRDRRKPRPKKQPGDYYSVRSYYRAVRRACDRAAIAPWHPHQLRHSAATRVRRAYGVEPTRVILGHASLAVTEVYAERDMQTARRIVREIG